MVLNIVGGLAAVIYTDTIQAFVMVLGAFTLMIISRYHTCRTLYLPVLTDISELYLETFGALYQLFC